MENKEIDSEILEIVTSVDKKEDYCEECPLKYPLKKNDWAFYNYQLNKRKHMLIFQNPGDNPDKIERDELEKAKDDIHKKIEAMRGGLKRWIHQKNKKFFEKFFKTLQKEKIQIGFSDFKQYCEQEEYLNYFYIADLVKCRKTKLGKREIEHCFNYLKEEIKYVKPKLIFIFGGLAWNKIREEYGLDPKFINKNIVSENLGKITNVHGYLFKLKDDIFVIPLAHMSQKQYNNLLRESYSDYLKEGLKKFKEQKV